MWRIFFFFFFQDNVGIGELKFKNVCFGFLVGAIWLVSYGTSSSRNFCLGSIWLRKPPKRDRNRDSPERTVRGSNSKEKINHNKRKERSQLTHFSKF